MSSSTAPPKWVHLGSEERVVWYGRPSVYTVLDDLIPAAVLAVVGVGIALGLDRVVDVTSPWMALLPLAFVLLGVATAVAAYIRWRSVRYVITTREVYRKRGVLSRSVTQIPVDRIQNTSYSQSALQRLLSYGDVTLFTAGSGTVDLVFRSVPNPDEVNRMLSEQLSAASR